MAVLPLRPVGVIIALLANLAIARTLRRRALRARGSGVDDLNAELAEVWADADSLKVRCAESREDNGRLREAAAARLAGTNAEVADIQAALVDARARYQELTTSIEKLRNSKDALLIMCGRVKTLNAEQKQLIGDGQELVGKVSGASPGSPSIAKLEGALKDHSVWLGKGGDKRWDSCMTRWSSISASLEDSLAQRVAANETITAKLSAQTIAAARQSNVSSELAAIKASEANAVAQCAAAAEDLEKQKAEVRKKRAELLGASASASVSDCVVTPWKPTGTCSAACGGGNQTLTRDVIRSSAGGMSCPKLSLQLPCNKRPCQTDCVVAEWGGWSECSAPCAGGHQTRERSIEVDVDGGGKPCDALVDMRPCNNRPCGACEFSDWGEWGLCTKACGGGRRGRRKALSSGDICPSEKTDFETCGADACPPSIKCGVPMDLVVVLDNSVLLDKAGFTNEIEFVAELLEGLQLTEGGSRAAAVAAGDEAPLTSDGAALQAWFRAVARDPKGHALERGLEAASRVLGEPRPGVPQTVLVLLGGRPDSLTEARREALLLQRRGVRVVLFSANPLLDEELLAEVASEPAPENVFRSPSFQALRGELPRSLAGLCPALAGQATSASPGTAWYMPPAPSVGDAEAA